ncbi:MAG: hypothetical protein ACLTDX_20610 [[Clostridium] innocuum]
MDELLSIVQKAVDEKKGERPLLYDFRELNPFIDHVGDLQCAECTADTCDCR